ncbi:hypothetical protein [Rossellomorea marisflavi]|uniref:hypothetical protein n=1 Tax=Rossellomorea marisflavi TaxID=189381 RepID=UPI00345D61AA
MENGTRMLIVLGVFIATYILLEWALGKWLKIEKKKKGYHNEQHKKWEIRTSGVLLVIVIISFMLSVDGGIMRDVLPMSSSSVSSFKMHFGCTWNGNFLMGVKSISVW